MVNYFEFNSNINQSKYLTIAEMPTASHENR